MFTDSIMWPIEIIIDLKGIYILTPVLIIILKRKLIFFCRIGWMVLILVFTYFTYSICAEQIRRFLNGPIVVSLDKDYRNWVYEPMAITICTDFLNKSVMDEIIQQYTNTEEDCDPDSYELYRQYFELIGSLNADNLHSISEYEHTDLFTNLTGEDLLSIAIKVSQVISSLQSL